MMGSIDLTELLSNAKVIFATISGILTLLIGRFAAPFEEDMPFPLKPVLVCLAVAEVFVMPDLAVHTGRVSMMIGLVASVLFFLLVYAGTYALYGYKKTVTVRHPILFWRGINKKVLILGGFRLMPVAAGHDPQDYFEDSNYEQDSVWTRGSRFAVQIVTVLSYICLIVSLIGVIAFATGVSGR
jgi:hypothetical protein